MADRVVVVSEGRITATIDRADATPENVMHTATASYGIRAALAPPRSSVWGSIVRLRELPVALALVAVVLFTYSQNPLFLSPQGTKDLLRHARLPDHHTARFNSVGATTGSGMELDVVAAAVVGRVAIFGGSGSVVGAALGALLLTTITSALTAVRVDKFWQQAIVGVLILTAIIVDRVASLRTARKHASSESHVCTSKTLAGEPKARTRWARLLLGRDAVMIYVLVAMILLFSLTIPRFASPVTVGFLFLDVIPVLLIAMPMTLIIITGEIDLSVAVLVGVMEGAFNGFLIAVVGLPSLAVTIGTLVLFRGLALVVIGDNAVAIFPAELTAFFTSKLGASGIPTIMIFVAVLVLIFGASLHFTAFGRGLYAMGFSKEAATWCTTSYHYVAARGFVAARAGVSIFGGKGSIPGVAGVTGVLLIRTINYALRFGRVSDVVLIIVTGALLIISVITSSIIDAGKRFAYDRRMKRELSQAPVPGKASA
ncbi:hypothetical protein QBC39DRAFT_334832 [Podospora conica]|nr:hypothetical protein QBC39DRAFT_334832 [Schizothecium conicum]